MPSMLAVSPTRQLVSVSLSVGVPVVGTLVAIVLGAMYGVPGYAWGLFLVGYCLTGIGVEVGIHRHFAHQAFQASPLLRRVLGVLGCTAAQGQILYWVANHRVHHASSDTADDPHSPLLLGGGLRGLWYGHVGWMFDLERNQLVLQHVDALARDPIVRWVDRRYGTWLLLSFVIPTAIGGLWAQSAWGALMGLLWGGAVRLFAAQHMVFAVNSLCHRFGRQPFDTNDESRDLVWLAPFTFGGFLHNTHHAFANTANNETAWYTLDPGYWVIRACAATGAAWGLKGPDAARIAKRRRRPRGPE